MTKKNRNAISILVSVIIAGFLVYWVSTAIDFNQAWSAIKDANFWYVGISFLLGAAAYWFRSQRWRLLLDSIHYKVSAKNAFAAVSMNYFSNLIIPRSGEIARCASAFKTNNIPIDKSFGTVIIERVIDFLCLFFVIGLTLVFKFKLVKETLLKALEQRAEAEPSYTKFYIAGAVLFLLGIGFLLFRKKIIKSKLYKKLIDFVVGIKEGVSSVSKLKQQRLFWLYTILIWVFYYFMTWIVVFAFADSNHLSWKDGLFLLVAGGIGMIIPASGGIGSYHAAMGIAFVALGLSENLGVSVGFVIHTPHSLLAVLLGVYAYFVIDRNNTSKKAL